MNMTPFRYRDIRENGYFRASEIPFNFEYLDYALKEPLFDHLEFRGELFQARRVLPAFTILKNTVVR